MSNITETDQFHMEDVKSKRCRQFIEMQKVDRPLIGMMWEPGVRPVEEYTHRIDRSQPARPEEISSEEMCRASDEIMDLAKVFPQDMYFATQACFGHQWLEAILGCRIMVGEDTIWAELPENASLEKLASFEVDEGNPWFQAMLACHASLVEHASGRYHVAVPVLHGPLDLLVAFVGAEQLSYDLFDRPQLVISALERVTGLWCAAAKRLSKLSQSYRNGFVSRMHIWTAQPGATAQNDATYLTSPEVYRQFIMPFEEQMSKAVASPVYHSHNTSLHILPDLAKIQQLRAVQMTVDPNGPPWEKQRQVIARFQESKPIILSCWNFSDAERAMKELNPRGLAITITVRIKDKDPGSISLEEYKQWYKQITE